MPYPSRLMFWLQARTLLTSRHECVIHLPVSSILVGKTKGDWNGAPPNRFFVRPGDWDRSGLRTVEMLELSSWRCINELFVECRPVTECEQYQRMIECARGGRPFFMWGCKSTDDVERYFQRLVGAFESIRAEGFKSQAELGGPRRDEIKVAIARTGAPIKIGSGNHRLAIAKVLQLDTIPVLVRQVHWIWAERQWRQRRGSLRRAIRTGLSGLSDGLRTAAIGAGPRD